MEQWIKPAPPTTINKSAERTRPRKQKNYIAAIAQIKNDESDSDPETEPEPEPEPIKPVHAPQTNKHVENHHHHQDDFVSIFKSNNITFNVFMGNK